MLRLASFVLLERRELHEDLLHKWYASWDIVVSYVQARQEEGVFRAVDAYYVVHGFRRMVTELLFEVSDLGEDAATAEFDGAIGAMIDVMLLGMRAQVPG
jgi:hypothetical protein